MSDLETVGTIAATNGISGSKDSAKIWTDFPIRGIRSPKSVISNGQATTYISLVAIGIIIVATAVLSGTLYKLGSGYRIDTVGDFIATGLLIAIIFCGILRFSAEQPFISPSSMYARANQALVVWIVSFAIFLALTFAGKFGTVISRGATISHFLLGLAIVPAAHMHVPALVARALKRNAFKFRDIILIGDRGDSALLDLVAELRHGGCEIPFVVEFDAACSNNRWSEEREALITCVKNLAHRLRPGEIYIAGGGIPRDRVQSILRLLTLVPRPVLVIPDSYTANLLCHRITEMGDEIAVAVQKEPLGRFGRAFKRSSDLILSTIGIVFLAPVFAAIAIAIKYDSRGPVLFKQTRNGYQGKPFHIFKFRTMTVMEDGDVILQARVGDRRVTRLGAFLRKSSLDELPQLFNVFRGEMSLIGPRPHARAHDELYAKVIENYEIRQHVKPGITGWAQVNGLRGETQTVDIMRRRIEFDLWYARNCSIVLDGHILLRTFIEVFRSPNAY